MPNKAKPRAPASPHPSHTAEIPRLKRIRGQVEGVERMIGEGRYCVDIITQIRAARSALLALENSVLKEHLNHCVQEALTTKNSFDAAKKIQEITALLGK
jgi:DNA-binding FrmR family transcriptional regulator